MVPNQLVQLQSVSLESVALIIIGHPAGNELTYPSVYGESKGKLSSSKGPFWAGKGQHVSFQGGYMFNLVSDIHGSIFNPQ